MGLGLWALFSEMGGWLTNRKIKGRDKSILEMEIIIIPTILTNVL